MIELEHAVNALTVVVVIFVIILTLSDWRDDNK